MDKNDQQQLAGQLGDLPWDDAPDTTHRDRLEANLLRAWATRGDPPQHAGSRWRALIRKGETIMTRRTTRYSAVAAAVAAVVLGWTFLPKSTHPGGTAWAVEQSIAALDGARTIFITGAVEGSDQPFRYRARHDPRTNQFCFRYESDRETCIFDGSKGYAYQPGSNQAITFPAILDLGALRFTPQSLTMQMWVRGQMLAMLKQTAQDWHETAGYDEQTHRPCVFVTCSYSQQNASLSLWVQFDQQTKLPVRAKLWRNLRRQGTPTFDARQIVYEGPVSNEGFGSQPPAGTTVVDSGEGLSLLAAGQKLFDQKRYDEAIATYQRVVEKYPGWSGAEEALMMIGISHDNMGQHDKAIPTLERAVRDYAECDLAATYFYLGTAYQGADRIDDARAAYQQSAERAEKIGRGNLFPGKTAREQIESLKSQADLTRAERLYGEHNFAEAITAYQAIVDAAPHSRTAREAQMMVGICYENMRQPQKAIEPFEHAVRDSADVQGPATPAPYFYLGDVYQQVGRKEDAIKTLIQCVQLAEKANRAKGFPADAARREIARLQLEMFGGNIPDWANVIDVAAERETIATANHATSLPQGE